MGLHSSAGRALERERRGHGFEFRRSPEKFFRAILQLLNLRFTAMVTYLRHLFSRSSHNFILSTNGLLFLSFRKRRGPQRPEIVPNERALSVLFGAVRSIQNSTMLTEVTIGAPLAILRKGGGSGEEWKEWQKVSVKVFVPVPKTQTILYYLYMLSNWGTPLVCMTRAARGYGG